MASTISVPIPRSGDSLTIASEAGAKINLGFDPGSATVSRSDNDLVFDVDGGGRVTLSDFFVVGDEALPSLVLPDGAEIAAADYLANFDIDIETAAGPGAGAGAGSGGSGDYSDDPGALLDGIDRLGTLGTVYWGRGTEVEENYTGFLATDAFIPSISIVPVLPDSPHDPDQPTSPENPVYYMDAAGYNLKVDESYMEGGTNYTGGDSPSYRMEFIITTNDGLASVTIDGVTYSVEGGTLSGFSSVSGANGSLTNAVVTDNGDGTYTLSFTYTQGSAHSHADEGKDTADNVDSFVIGVTSLNGANDSVTVNVDIVDDVPVISVAEEAPALSAVVDESPLGDTYKDGELSATLAAEDVQAQFDVNFGYDGEGSSSYSLNLNTGGEDSVGSGLYAVAAGGGQGEEIMLSHDGDVITGSTSDGTVYFTLSINPDTGEVTLTQHSNIWHSEAGGTEEAHDAAEALILAEGVLTLEKTVTDADDDTASASIDLGAAGVFSFEDDGPKADGDFNTIEEAGESASVSGNVLENDASGADGWRADPVELQGDGQGAYGTLELNADGTYTYTRNEAGVPDAGAEEVFTYRVYDADGDWAEATLTITLTNTPPTANDPSGTELTVTLSDVLAAGDDVDMQTVSYDMFDGPEDFTAAVFTSNEPTLEGGEDLTWSLSEDGKTWTGSNDNGPVVIVTLNGIQADGTVSVTATLVDPASHAVDSDSITISGITVKATDAGGSAVEGAITVTIADDGPTVTADTNTISEDGTSVKGNVLTNDASGADGWAADAVALLDDSGDVVSSGTIEGDYGTLVLNADGSYTYTRNDVGVSDEGAEETFHYRAYDADGDYKDTTLTITVTITVTNSGPTVTDNALNLALQDVEAAGSLVDTDTKSVDMFDSPEDFTAAVFTSDEPTLEGGEDLTWSLSEDGKTWTGSNDNGPVVTVTLDGIQADGTVSVTATLADPASHVAGSDAIIISGITVKATDASNSTVEGAITVTIADDNPTAGNGEAQVSEAYIETPLGWNQTGSGSDDDDDFPDSAQASGTIELDYGADGPAETNAFTWNLPDTTSEDSPFSSLQAMVNGEWSDIVWTVSEDGLTLSGKVGDYTVIKVVMEDAATGAYTVEIFTGLKHDDPDTGSAYDYNTDFGQNDETASTPLEFGYTITDADGDSATGALAVTVQDDVLSVEDSESTVSWHKGEELPPDVFENSDPINLSDSTDKTAAGAALSEAEKTSLANQGLTVSAALVTFNADGTVSFVEGADAGQVYMNNTGMFISGSSIDDAATDRQGNVGDRFHEINYDAETGTSEALVINLDGIAYGVTISLTEFYGGELESGCIYFYLNGELVGWYEFSSNAVDGNWDGTFETIVGGFDQVVIVATDNGNGVGEDNSDFSISSIQFATYGEFVHYAEGNASGVTEAVGSDGIKAGSLTLYLTESQQTVETTAGEVTVNVNEDGNKITGTLDGETASPPCWTYTRRKAFCGRPKRTSPNTRRP